jgi:hypothetical protein
MSSHFLTILQLQKTVATIFLVTLYEVLGSDISEHSIIARQLIQQPLVCWISVFRRVTYRLDFNTITFWNIKPIGFNISTELLSKVIKIFQTTWIKNRGKILKRLLDKLPQIWSVCDLIPLLVDNHCHLNTILSFFVTIFNDGLLLA